VSSEVILIDNASKDGTAAAVRAAFPTVRLIESPTNLGFAGGNNRAMVEATGRYLLLLNTDAFVEPGAIAAMVAYLDGHPKTAAVGPRLHNGDGSLQQSCYRFPTPGHAWAQNLWLAGLFGADHPLGDFSRWPHDTARSVDWVIGACVMVRRSVYDRVGGFDERFFMYSEETDWQRRMRTAGWDVAFTPAARVTHLGGGSATPNKPAVDRHFWESLDRYVRKHHGFGGLFLFHMAMVVGGLARMPVWAVLSVVPKRSTVARAKLALQSRLVVRQLTHWRAVG
jgi:GT2 family glycosyltransferase